MEIFNEVKYYTTLKFIFIKAIYDLYPEARVDIRHSLNGGIYGVIKKGSDIFIPDMKKVKKRMRDLSLEDLAIDSVSLAREEIDMYMPNRKDVFKLFDSLNTNRLRVFKLGDYYDYFHNDIYSSTGFANLFDLEEHSKGFILRYPYKGDPHSIERVGEHPKIEKVFNESHRWGKILEIDNVGELNEVIDRDEFLELISVNEALHHKKLANIAEDITNGRDIKLISVAGPSSSGKTTFTKRLAIHLRVNGLKPLVISLDNYYRGRKYVPLDENGEKDFEALEALDLKLLSKNITDLIEGKGVEVPLYDFNLGERKPCGVVYKLPKNGVLLIEGIHGLNDNLLGNFPRDNRYNIYISCLTTLNIDNHNRIPTSEVRKLRRIVRDSLSRGTSAEGTLAMWDSVRRGEVKNIFPFQENADAIFDSNLIYELSVLKEPALAELSKIRVTSHYFEEARVLIKFLNYFNTIEASSVPDDSILKEFTGGSFFYKY